MSATTRRPQRPATHRIPTAKAAAAFALVLLIGLTGLLPAVPASASADAASVPAAAAVPGSVEDGAAAGSAASFEAPPSLAADLSASAMRLRWESPTRGLSESFRSRLRAGSAADAAPAAVRPSLRPPYDPVEGRSARSSSLRLLLQTAQLAAG